MISFIKILNNIITKDEWNLLKRTLKWLQGYKVSWEN